MIWSITQAAKYKQSTLDVFLGNAKSTVISDDHVSISPNVATCLESNESTAPTMPKLSSLQSTSPSSREKPILVPRKGNSSDHFYSTPTHGIKRNRHQLANATRPTESHIQPTSPPPPPATMPPITTFTNRKFKNNELSQTVRLLLNLLFVLITLHIQLILYFIHFVIFLFWNKTTAIV